jgi:biopolymer transport protein ExbD
MARIEQAAVQRRSKSFARNKKTEISIDMTPMVDLGFLLITFFVFTTSLSQPAAMKLNMPAHGIEGPTLAESLALSVLLDGKNRIYYYHGSWEEAERNSEIFKTNYSTLSGLGEIIRQKQKAIDASGKFPEGKNELMLLIKPGKESTYQHLVDALDEALINDVKKYAVVEMTKEEKEWLRIRK